MRGNGSNACVAAALLLAACSPVPAGPKTLALAGPVAHLAVMSGGSIQDALTLRSTSVEETSCPALLGMSEARVDDVLLSAVMYGSWHGAGGKLCLRDCVARCEPHIWLARHPSARPDTEETTFSLKDGTTTWSMTVEHLYATRRLTRVGSGPLHAGDTVVMDWSQASDVVGGLPPRANLILEDGGERLSSTDGGTIPAASGFPLSYDAGVVGFSVPPNLAAGTYLLRLGTPPVPRVTSCVGPSSCSAEVAQDWDVVRMTVEE